MSRLREYINQKPTLKTILKPIVKASRAVFQSSLNWTLKPISKSVVAGAAYFIRWADGKSWVPIFYFFLSTLNTEGIQRLHILHKIQVETGRRVIVISPWWFWPASSAKDPFFVSFIKGLTPGIRYVWIPKWLQYLIHNIVTRLLRSAGRYEAWLKPRDINCTVRYYDFSTIDHTDLLNYGSRVVFHIPKSHEYVLEQRLKDLGVSPNDWFVCVHAREHGWCKDLLKQKHYSVSLEEHRNVDIRDYFPAIGYIRSKGGKVVRIGDPSMTRVKGVDGFIDYPFTKYWSLPMDLFIISRCRFFLGCCSGAIYFPPTFGKPTLITNFPGPAFTIRFPYSNILFLTKHVVEKESGRVLSLQEMFEGEGRRCIMNDAVKFEAMGFRWESNKPEDILEATKEMLYRIETDSFDRKRTKEQELFHQLRLKAVDFLCSTLQGHGKFRFSNGRSSQSRISATFAARYFAQEASQRARSRDGVEAVAERALL